jgi:hypothetical protein
MLVTNKGLWISKSVIVSGPDDSEDLLKFSAYRAADEFLRHYFEGKCVVGDYPQAEIVRIDPVTFAVDGVVQTATWFKKVVTHRFSALVGIGNGPVRIGVDASMVDVMSNGLFHARYFFYARALRVQRNGIGDFDLVAGVQSP